MSPLKNQGETKVFLFKGASPLKRKKPLQTPAASRRIPSESPFRRTTKHDKREAARVAICAGVAQW